MKSGHKIKSTECHLHNKERGSIAISMESCYQTSIENIARAIQLNFIIWMDEQAMKQRIVFIAWKHNCSLLRAVSGAMARYLAISAVGRASILSFCSRGSDPSQMRVKQSALQSLWLVLRECLSLIFLSSLLTPSRPDSSILFNPNPSFSWMTSHEWANTLWRVGVILTHSKLVRRCRYVSLQSCRWESMLICSPERITRRMTANFCRTCLSLICVSPLAGWWWSS